MSKKEIIRVPVEFLANINGRPKPYMETWLLLKTQNKSSHYKNLNKNYDTIARSIKVSTSTLRSHIKQMVKEGYATIENNSLRLVSVWRNPTRYKERSYTHHNYGKIQKALINPRNLKLEVFQYKLKQQISRQNYREKEKLKLIGKKPKNRLKEIKVQLLTDVFENGSTSRMRTRILEDTLIPLAQKENVYEKNRKGLNLVCEALACKLALNEGNSISKSSSLSLVKLSELTSYSSNTSLRMFRRLLKEYSGLSEEVSTSIPLKNKKFSMKYHYKDKFGNIYRKECIRYDVSVRDMVEKIEVRNKPNDIPCI